MHTIVCYTQIILKFIIKKVIYIKFYNIINEMISGAVVEMVV